VITLALPWHPEDDANGADSEHAYRERIC